jgi:hypothetical protein
MSPATQREAVPDTPRTFTLFDSLGRPRSEMTSSSLIPSWTLRKFSWFTFEQAAIRSAATSATSAARERDRGFLIRAL